MYFPVFTYSHCLTWAFKSVRKEKPVTLTASQERLEYIFIALLTEAA